MRGGDGGCRVSEELGLRGLAEERVRRVGGDAGDKQRGGGCFRDSHSAIISTCIGSPHLAVTRDA